MVIKSHNAIDDELLAAAKSGDQRAYTALLEKYRNSIFHIILKIVKSSEDAEDLTIETFAKAFDRLYQYSPEYAFSTWLFKIASNTSIDFLRRKSIDKVSLDQQDISITDNIRFSTANDPEMDLIKSQRQDKLQKAVNEMDEIFSRVIQLRYFKEYNYEEISAELGIPVGTIKIQLYRARKLLFKKLSEEKDKW
ncbi:MAG: RNA polymerase sigma factor [Sphingobacteriales bacterium]|nr:RNA polymerase sigma factor [Sphingobacteriales bacterium]